MWSPSTRGAVLLPSYQPARRRLLRARPSRTHPNQRIFGNPPIYLGTLFYPLINTAAASVSCPRRDRTVSQAIVMVVVLLHSGKNVFFFFERNSAHNTQTGQQQKHVVVTQQIYKYTSTLSRITFRH